MPIGSCQVAASLSTAQRRWRGRFADVIRAASARLVVALFCVLNAGCAPALTARGSSLSAREVAVLDARGSPSPGMIAALAWSPDGGRIAAAGFGEHPMPDPRSLDAMLWDVPAPRLVATVPRAQPLRFAFAFTPDSRLLAMPAARPPGTSVVRGPGPDHLSLVDAQTGAVVGAVPSGLPPPPPGGAPHDIAVSPAGGRAAAAFPGHGLAVVIYDAPPGGGAWRPASGFTLPWLSSRGLLAFAPDGRQLAVAGGRSSLPGSPFSRPRQVVEARDLGAGGGPAWSVDLGEGAAMSLAWGGPDGGLVALGLSGNAPAGTVGERVVALDARTGAQRWAASWPAASVGDLAFSPDGRLLAAASRGDEVRVLDAATGAELLAIGGLREPRAVAWGPAGPGPLLLAFNDGPRIRIVEVAP